MVTLIWVILKQLVSATMVKQIHWLKTV